MVWVGISAVVLVCIVLGILYWRFARQQLAGAQALTDATQEALDASNAEFVERQKEERHADKEAAAAVTDSAGATEFLRGSFSTRKKPKL